MQRWCAMVALVFWTPYGAAQPLALELRPAALLAQARVTLADVAIVAGGEPLATLELGVAPRIGYVERLSREQIGLMIRRRAGVTREIAWSGAASVALQSQSQTIGSEALAQVAVRSVLAAWQARLPGITVDLAAPPGALEVPFGAIEIKARALSEPRLAARMPVWIDIRVDGAVYRSLVVALNVTARQPVHVARRALAAGTLADAGDFEQRDENVVALDAMPAAPAAAGWRMRRALAAGQILTQASLPQPGMIFRGDTVRLLILRGAVEIEARGVALADAAPGQPLAVRLPNASEPVNARVSPTGAVVMEME
ncbi:flagella basal body P-ring formation protein FlgA [Massilia violaceinigra]|uniref:Flagella basal body P-ring formation protein FlgA n=1 Tax=Massilia violaceinigra TaxID=2045208 RepID=A0A2D2DH63_9BURK|nr:flagellar basal body P-ring formation chaperone FlgA [Massilia violaceinigra]ATQ74314.1 flagella basal body P-ring formation protein FlgA [Massilia violaceinigra]